MKFIFSLKNDFTSERSEGLNLFPLEDKLHMLAPPCNILYILNCGVLAVLRSKFKKKVFSWPSHNIFIHEKRYSVLYKLKHFLKSEIVSVFIFFTYIIYNCLCPSVAHPAEYKSFIRVRTRYGRLHHRYGT